MLGAGDAFMAGFLRGWLRDEPLATCCDYANACGALVVSRHGCAPAMPTWPELARTSSNDGPRPRRLREDAELEHLHWATTRRRDYAELCVLAMDHRSQFEALAAEARRRRGRIDAFKLLGLAAVRRVAGGDRRLRHAARRPLRRSTRWSGRPTSLLDRPADRGPGRGRWRSRAAPTSASSLREWPLRQVVKCLVRYHPDDDAGAEARQERQLLRLFDACPRHAPRAAARADRVGGGPAARRVAAR